MDEMNFLETLVHTIKEGEQTNSDAEMILTKVLLLLLNRVQFLHLIDNYRG